MTGVRPPVKSYTLGVGTEAGGPLSSAAPGLAKPSGVPLGDLVMVNASVPFSRFAGGIRSFPLLETKYAVPMAVEQPLRALGYSARSAAAPSAGDEAVATPCLWRAWLICAISRFSVAWRARKSSMARF